jgi:hypothetical protein
MPTVWPTTLCRRVLHAVSATAANRARLVVFAAAFAVRFVLGGLFFGSIDVVNSATGALALLDGKAVALPYFPTVNAFLWLAGVLAAHLPVPFPLALKIVPILFDSLLAVLIFDLVARQAPRMAFRAAILYASSPLLILNTSIHGQWDSIALFFLLLAFAVREGRDECRAREVLFGFLFGASVLAKPIALPFVLLFLRRKGVKQPKFWNAAAGFALAICAAFLVYSAYGYSGPGAFLRIASYSAGGVQIFGLPFAPLVAKLSLQSGRLLWVVPEMLVLALLYHRRRLTAIDAMLLFYLLSLGTTGISPQYLAWPIPLLLVSGRLRLASIYTAVAMPFLLLYYSNPWASYLELENLATFVPLRSASWLLPSAWLATRELLPWVRVLGNVVFPLTGLAIAIAILRKCMIDTAAKPVERGGYEWRGRVTAWYLTPAILLAATIFFAKLTVNGGATLERLRAVWAAIPAHYAMQVESLVTRVIFAPDTHGASPLNIVVLLALLTAAWCVVSGGIFWRDYAARRSWNAIQSLAGNAQPSEPEAKPKKAAEGATPAKKAKAAKKAAPEKYVADRRVLYGTQTAQPDGEDVP